MNCDQCKRGGEDGATILRIKGATFSTVVVPCHAARDDIEITCKRFTPKLKTIDPSATCEDCGCYEPTETRCKQHGWFKNPGDIACVQIDAKKPKPDEPQKTLAPSAFPLGDRATCRQCDEPIEWHGEYWVHVDSSPRHIGQPKETTA